MRRDGLGRAREALERSCRDVLELRGDRVALGELTEGGGVLVVCPDVMIGDPSRRALGVRVEHHDAIAHRSCSQGEHPAELSTAEHAERGAGQDHPGEGSLRSLTRAVCARLNSVSFVARLGSDRARMATA